MTSQLLNPPKPPTLHETGCLLLASSGFYVRFHEDGRPMARMSFRTSTGQYYFNFTKTEVQRVRRECNRILKEMEASK